MLVLGLESSCDDTCLSLMGSDGSVIREDVWSQLGIHRRFGGVVPEFASRAHVLNLQEMIGKYTDLLLPARSNVGAVSGDAPNNLLCVTTGPGLVGSLFVGFSFAIGLSSALQVPVMKINHLEGHLLSPFIEHRDSLRFPFLSLIISGGHCQFVLAKSLGNYSVIGRSIDDAPGEVFDKVGRFLGIDYPGGAKIDALAQRGKRAFEMPLPMLDSKKYGLDMSFSGLKTSVFLLIKKLREGGVDIGSQEVMENLCASFQFAVGEVFRNKLAAAIEFVSGEGFSIRQVCICGGVAANSRVRSVVTSVASSFGMDAIFPSLRYCTDNATMIANVGLMRSVAFGLSSGPAGYVLRPDSSPQSLLADAVVAKWPLEDMVATS